MTSLQGVYGLKVFEAQHPKPFWLGATNLNARYMGGWVKYELNSHLPAGGLFESQVLPPGWWLWNQLSGADGRMRKQQVLEDMQGIQSLLLGEVRFCLEESSRPAAREGSQHQNLRDTVMFPVEQAESQQAQGIEKVLTVLNRWVCVFAMNFEKEVEVSSSPAKQKLHLKKLESLALSWSVEKQFKQMERAVSDASWSVLITSGKAPTAGITVRHVRHSHSRKSVRVKKGVLVVREHGENCLALMKKYINTGDVELAASDLRELGSNEYHPCFIKRLVSMAMNRRDKEKEMASVVFLALYADVISFTQIGQGFFILLESADDLAVDVLDAVDVLTLFIARAEQGTSFYISEALTPGLSLRISIHRQPVPLIHDLTKF
ncbi:hypothetical protein CK203_031181 [Vitis vinifera]|uniref:MI domain-containing protein n=2 Tax=Vitis vinifera TaxID=29760 RepID=A0A438J0G6_VITVI|nr:hypothetical protein CK203_031181 [Vitis vinifera]